MDDDGFTNWHVRLKATVKFPADAPGATMPSQISAAQSNYPMVMIIHGNGPDGGYLGYDYLLDHLAKNGFIAASIHLEPGQSGTDRARVCRRHLLILFGMFGSHAANNIGIMGHSRGGEAVVIATRLNHQESWGYNINAVISLAPTNQYTSEHFGGAWAKPYLVIYGSLDGDLGFVSDNGFELYDHAKDGLPVVTAEGKVGRGGGAVNDAAELFALRIHDPDAAGAAAVDLALPRPPSCRRARQAPGRAGRRRRGRCARRACHWAGDRRHGCARAVCR